MDPHGIASLVLGAVIVGTALALAWPLGVFVTRLVFPQDRPLGGRAQRYQSWRGPSQAELTQNAIDSLTPEPLRHHGSGEPEHHQRWRA